MKLMLKKYFLKTYSSALLIIILISSCNLDEFDFDLLSDQVVYKPGFAFPIARVKATIEDFLDKSDTTIVIDKSNKNLLKIRYDQSDLIDVSLSEVFDISSVSTSISQSMTTETVDISDVSGTETKITLRNLTDNFPALSGLNAFNGAQAPFPGFNSSGVSGGDYNFTALDQFQSATFESGTMELTMDNQLPVIVSATYQLRSGGSLVGEFVFTDVAAGQTKTVSLNLAGKTFTNAMTVNLKEFVTPGSSGSNVSINLDGSYMGVKVDIKNAKINSGVVKVTDSKAVESSTEYPVDIGDGIKLKKLTLKTGTINFTISSAMTVDMEMKIKLPRGIKDNDTLQTTINIPNGQTINYAWHITGSTLDLFSPATSTYNSLLAEFEVSVSSGGSYINYASGQTISVTAGFANLELDYAEGNFGQMEVKLDSGNFDIGTDFFEFYDKVDGEFSLTNPSMGLTLKSSIGIPAQLDLQVTGIDKIGNTSSLDAEKQSINYPKTVSEGEVETVISYNKDNSNIVGLLDLPPDESISYKGSVKLNPDDTTVSNNFIYGDSKVSGGLFFEVPFQISAKDMSYSDTTNLDSFDSSYEDFNDYFKSAEMSMQFTSGLPLGLSVIISFLDDSSNTPLVTLDPFTIDPAPVDDSSFISANSEGTAKLSLNKSQADKIYKSTRMIYQVKVNSFQNKGVNITSDASLEFMLAMKVLFNISNLNGG